MKKLMLSLAVACVSAITAFAESWFDNVVTNGTIPETSGQWSTGISALMGDNNYITYKDMENDLIFTAKATPTLPGDAATVNTTVKFTAMAMEDFIDLTNKNEEAWADAKGGLTIIEEPEGTYNYYGIVNGTWQVLTGDAGAVIANNKQVPVEVKIWENNGRKISYKVDGSYIGNSETGLAAEIADDKLEINQIAYRGNCEIVSLTGIREAVNWDITLDNLLAGADAKLRVGGVDYEITDGTASIRGTTQQVQVVYSIPSGSGKMFFKGGDAGTALDQTKILGGVIGSNSYDATLSGVECATVVAKVVDGQQEASYKSLENAIAAGAGKTVKVVYAPEVTAQTIHATMNLDATGFTVAGDITINNAAALTILGGNFSGTITNGELLISGPSTFAQINKDTASGLCATGWFAREGTVAGSSYVEAGAADPVEVASGVEIKYDDKEVSVDDLKKPATETGNGQPGWVNYAMGLDAVTTVKPNIVKAEADDKALLLASSTKGRPGTGFVITMTKNGDAFDGTLTLAAGTNEIKTVLSDGNGKTVDVVTKTIGVDKPTVSDAEKTDVKLVTVPYKQIDGSEMTIDEVINKANLDEDDELHIFNGSYYDHYKLDKDGAWKKEGVAGAEANSVPTVKPGQGIWLKTGATYFFQYGLVEATAPQVELKAGWNLLGVASETLDVSGIAANDGDMIRVENVATKLPVEYTYDGANKQWTWVEAVVTTNYIEKLKRNITTKTFEQRVVDTPIRVNGNGVWYVRKGEPTKISL